MTKVKSYKSPKTEVREESVAGKGLFAREDIKKGEILFVKSGHIVHKKDALRYDKELGEYSLQITGSLFLCPTTKGEVEDTAIFINHSCNPNVGPDGQITFVALRDIKAGEELCYDYAMTTDYNYKLECKCGDRSCRGVVTGKDWQRKDLQEKYGNHFTYHILKKIKSRQRE